MEATGTEAPENLEREYKDVPKGGASGLVIEREISDAVNP